MGHAAGRAPVPLIVVGLPVLVFLVAGGIAAGLGHATWPAALAARASERRLLEREAAFRARLEARPDDDEARLQLAIERLHQALVQAQYATEQPSEPGASNQYAYPEQLAAVLPRSPAFLEAQQLAREVAMHAREPRLRARAWFRLSQMRGYAGDRVGQRACLEAAAREEPGDAAYREGLALLESASSPAVASREGKQ